MSETFEDQLKRHLEPFPPHMPEGWWQAMPFSIQRGKLKIVAAVQSHEAPRAYCVKFDNFVTGVLTYLDTGGQEHRSKPDMKILNPPYFQSFGEAVEVANAYLTASKV